MKLQLFNSLKKGITFIDLQPGQTVNIYLCGPTVYDHIHVGNLRSVIIFDVLHRLLLRLGINVNYVQNITDIDDKIIAKAQKERKSEKEISKHYAKAYFDNLIRYNILFPTYSPFVTSYIPKIKEFISSLLDKNFAYSQGENIFFLTSVSEEYGKLSGQKLEKLRNVRTISQSDKVDSKDFLLWKKTNEGISWNSPWGLGRPGWHTECAVFINEFFHSQTIDIHGGGNDLLFPHHENERIQYLTHNSKELSKIWLHIAHINWKKEKMSKSLGNVILAKHFFQKYGANVFRYLVLNSPYNQIINLTEELIQQGVDYIQKITNLLKRISFYFYLNDFDIGSLSKEAINIDNQLIQISNLLFNNLDSIKVLFFLEELIAFINRDINSKKGLAEISEKVKELFVVFDILGFNFYLFSYNFEVKLLIKKWKELQAIKDFYESDKVRDRLCELNIL